MFTNLIIILRISDLGGFLRNCSRSNQDGNVQWTSLPSFFLLWKYSLSILRTFLDLKEICQKRGPFVESKMRNYWVHDVGMRNADRRVVKKEQCSSLFRISLRDPDRDVVFAIFSRDQNYDQTNKREKRILAGIISYGF